MKEDNRTIHIENHVLMQEIIRMFNELGKESATLTVRGYSMRPFLEDRRDKVILAPPRKPEIGDVVLAKIAENRYAMHRVIKIENEIYTMQGDGNPTYMSETFREADIVGIAQAFIRKGKVITTTSTTWRIYSATWRILKPLRRILLAIYRRIHKNKTI